MIAATIALLLLYFSGGAGFSGFLPENFDDRVEDQILDTERQEQILDIIEQMETETQVYSEWLDSKSGDISDLYHEYHTTRNDYRNMLDEILNNRRETQKKVIEHFYKMKDLITPDEWEPLFAEIKE